MPPKFLQLADFVNHNCVFAALLVMARLLWSLLLKAAG